jgi:hypothetical protein
MITAKLSRPSLQADRRSAPTQCYAAATQIALQVIFTDLDYQFWGNNVKRDTRSETGVLFWP